MILLVTPSAKEQLIKYREQMITIYRDAFSLPPYNKKEDEIKEFADFLPHVTDKEGFQLIVALVEETGSAVGFAYGYSNKTDPLFRREAAKVMPSEMADEWLNDYFRLVEIAVSPMFQGQGIGGLLHDEIIKKVNVTRAILATMAAETTAYQMYRSRGWITLIDNINFPVAPRPYRVMGLHLNDI